MARQLLGAQQYRRPDEVYIILNFTLYFNQATNNCNNLQNTNDIDADPEYMVY